MLHRVRQDVAQLRDDCQEMLQQKEEQEELLQQREKELSALKGALKEEVETHDQYMAALKEEHENDFQKLLREFDRFKEVTPIFLNMSYLQKMQSVYTFCLTGPHSAGSREGQGGRGETLS